MRVFKRELLESAESLDQNIGIDELLISQAILKCNKLVNIDKSFYYILERQGSVSRAVVTEKIAQQGMLVHKLICELVEDTEPTLIMYPREKYLSYLLFLFFNLEHSENIVDLKTSIIKEFKENYKVVKVNGYWSSKKLRILSLGFNFNPFLFEKIYKLIK